MIRIATLLFALLAGATSATAQCSTSFECNSAAGGEPGSTGGSARSSPEPVQVSGELIRIDGLGSATYFAEALYGSVGTSIGGVFAPVGGTYGYKASADAVSTGNYVIEGPAGSTAELSFNLDFDGMQELDASPTFLFAGLRTLFSLDIYGKGSHGCLVSRGLSGTDTPGCSSTGAFLDDLVETISADGSHFGTADGHLTTSPHTFAPGTYAFGFSLSVVAEFLSSGRDEVARFENHFHNTFSFASEGPIANLPEGWNFYGPNVVNNRFVPPVTAPIPEPSTIALSLTGLLILARKVRRLRPRV